MQRAGVLGYPLGHSISPQVFQAAFDAAGIEGRYEAWPAPPEDLEMLTGRVRDTDVLGANVTIPHKESIVPLLDGLDEVAERIGAVNTIVNKDGKLTGHNTDVAGFARALREDASFDTKGKRIAVIGGGGAARAVVLALVEGRASYVMLIGRTPRRLEGVVATFRQSNPPGTTVSWTHWGDGVFLEFLPAADLLINCTPVGTRGSESEDESPLPAEHLPASGTVFDLVYNPPETPMLRAARERGLTSVSGLGMLVYQAAESFRLWTGQDADVTKMLAAGREALGL